jgi:ribonuclease BN (tRNA processing enzyme)
MRVLKFLGTAGARFVMLKQLRSSGGLWLIWDKTKVIIDPGPGSLIRVLASGDRLDPSQLDGIILTHRHLDHSAEVNIMIEAMTAGGFKKKGIVFAPEDCLKDDPVILKYNRKFVDKIEVLKENRTYQLKDITFQTAKKHIHNVQTYGLNFTEGKDVLLSLLTDTRYFKGLAEQYPGKILVINVVRFKAKKGLEHLDIEGVRKILSQSKCKICILTHFGMTMLKNNPCRIAENLSKEFKDKKIIAAYDGMRFDLEGVKVQGPKSCVTTSKVASHKPQA